MTPQQKKRAALNRERRKLINARIGDPCEIRWDEQCKGVGNTLHEPLLRSRGGDAALEQGTVWTCFNCHFNVHIHPAEATKRGWMIHAWDERAAELGLARREQQ